MRCEDHVEMNHIRTAASCSRFCCNRHVTRCNQHINCCKKGWKIRFTTWKLSL